MCSLVLLSQDPYKQKKYIEAQKIEWMNTEEFLARSLKKGFNENPDELYDLQLVQPFAFYIT